MYRKATSSSTGTCSAWRVWCIMTWKCELPSATCSAARLASLLVEKLDACVSVSLPQPSHSKHGLELARRKAGLLAIHNAKEKAKEMARFVHLLVGRPVSISETETKEWEGGQGDDASNPDQMVDFKNMLETSTVNIRSEVSMCFELKSKGKTNISP